MADTRMPVAGEPAQIDGMAYTVMYVDEAKAKVKIGDEDAHARKDRAAAIRAEFDTRRAEAQAAFEAAETPAEAALAKANMGAINAECAVAFEAVPRGTSVGIALKDFYWMEEAGMWSVPGRFHAWEAIQGHPKGGARPADPAELTIAAGR